MIDIELKRRAFAAMDRSATFELRTAAHPPDGEHVVALILDAPLDEIRPVAAFLGRMAETFFADRFMARIDHILGDGPVGLYLVGTLDDVDP